MANDRTVRVGITGDAKSLVDASKQGERGLDLVEGAARDAGKTLEVMGKKADRATRFAAQLGRASQAIRSSGKAIAWGSDKIVNQYTALAGGAGLVMGAKLQMNFDNQLTQMGIAARDAEQLVNGVDFSKWFMQAKKGIMDVAQTTGQAPEMILAGMQAIVQRTGDIKLATAELDLMAKAATASGSAVEDIGALIASLDQKAGIHGVEQMSQALTLLIAQGKGGAFELKEIVSQGERMFAVMSLFGNQGMDGLKSFGAFMQSAKRDVGNAENAANAIEGLGAAMARTKFIQERLGTVGIRVKLDSKASMESNIKKIIVAAKGDIKKLYASQAFGEVGIRAIAAMTRDYAEGKGFEAFDKFKEIGGDLEKNNMLQKDFQDAANTSWMQWNRLTAAIRALSDGALASPLSGLTDAMKWLNEHGTATRVMLTGIGTTLAAAFATVGVVKFAGLVQQFRQLKGATGAIGGGARGSSAVSALGATPVFVVNMPGGGIAGAPGAGSTAMQAEGAIASQVAKRGLLSRAGGAISSLTPQWIKTVGSWIGTGSSWIGRSAKSGLGSAAALADRIGLTAAGQGALKYGSKYGSSALRMGGKVVGGSAIGAALALPFELWNNEDKARAFAASAGAGLGGFGGGLLGGISGLGVASAPLGVAGGVGGSIAGRELAVFLYDLIKKDAEAKQPIVLNLRNEVDASGRSTTTVEGPGASLVDFRPSLASKWAPA